MTAFRKLQPYAAMNAYSNKTTGKLLVAVLAMAMVIACAAVIISSDKTVAADSFPTDEDDDGVISLDTEGPFDLGGTIAGDLVVNGNDKTINITSQIMVASGTVTFNNVTFNSSLAGVNISTNFNQNIELVFNNCTFNFTNSGLNTIYIDDGNSAVFNNCTFSGVSVVFNQSTGALPEIKFTGTTEGKPNLEIQTVTDATYGDDLVANGVAFGNVTLYATGEGATKDKPTNFIIPTGEVLNAESIKSNESDAAESKVTVEEGANVIVANPSDIIDNANPSMGISDSTIVFADNVVNFAGSVYLTGELTIPEGKTLNFTNGASLNLMGNKLTVEGTLSVENGAYVMDTSTTNGIVLTPTGTIQNAGVIGYQSQVKVSAVDENGDAAAGSVTMMNVEGVSFGIETVWSGNTSESTLTVSGDVFATSGSMTTYTIDVTSAKIVEGMSIDDEVVFTSNGAVVTDGATLTVDGTMAGSGLNMTDGSIVVINGDASDVPMEAETGKYLTSSKNITGFQYATAQVTLDNVTGVTLTVSSTNYTEERSNWTEQTLYISGSTTLIDDTAKGTITFAVTPGAYKENAEATDTVAFNAISKVAADATIILDEKITLDGAGLVVLGEIQYPASGSNASNVLNFVGTEYFVKESASVTTGYVTSFDAALAAIDTADNKKITVYGPLEITTGFELNDGQTVALDKSAVMDIGTDAKVNVYKGADITGTVHEVEGILFVQKGATVAKPTMYAVSGTNKETGDVTYAGFEAAIKNSAAGDVITVVAQGYDATTGITVENAIEIPADRTVVIDNGKKIVFEKNLTIAEGATLTNKGTVEMTGEKAVITDNGTFDNTAGAVSFTQTGGNVNIAGQYIISDATKLPTSGANYAVNGAYYADKGKTVVTTFAKAATAVGEMQGIQTVTVIGKITESGDVTLTQDNVLITGEATLGTVTINNTTLTVQNGSLTATVAGTYGADGSTTAASVSLSKTQNIIVENYSGVDSMNVTTWYTSINGVSGVVAVTGGEIVYDAATMTLSEANSMKVNSGATLVIPEETTNLTISGQYLDIEGTLAVEGAVSLGGMTVEGTIDVTGSLTVTDGSELIVLGTINVSADEEENATFTVEGTLVLGEKPEILGTSTTGTVTGAVIISNGVIEIYDGASVADATITNSAEVAIDPTTLVVNGYDYITVYTDVSTTIASYNTDILALKDIEDDQTIVWYTDGVEIGADAKIGDYAEVTTEVAWATADITISIGSRISLSIDGVIVDTYNGRTYELSIGTHNVVAIIDPGYTGDVTIAFNGQAVGEDGTITVTSDMIDAGVVLSVMGQLSQDIVISGGDNGGDNGLGLTDYLLIILVILIVIMAIMVAMRLMRS